MLTFDRFMEEIELEKYLKSIPKHYTGGFRYNPVSMLKTVLFGFMTNGYISLRKLEDQCKVNLRFMYLMEHATPSYRTFFKRKDTIIFQKDKGRMKEFSFFHTSLGQSL